MITIIPVQSSDLEFVYKYICDLEDQELDMETFTTVFLSHLQTVDIFGFIIKNENTSIGYISIHVQTLLHHCGRVAEIQELIVLNKFRSSGAGTAAIDFAKKFALEKKCVMLELACNLKRIDAHRFYLKNGFINSHYKFTYDLEKPL